MKAPNELKELTPNLSEQEILDKIFKKKFRGYDPVQVNAFLDLIIEDYSTFAEHFTNMQNYVQQLEAKTVNSSETVSQRPISFNDLDDELKSNIEFLKRIINHRKDQNKK